MGLENSKAMLSGQLWSVSVATDLINEGQEKEHQRISRFQSAGVSQEWQGQRWGGQLKEFPFLESLEGNLER